MHAAHLKAWPQEDISALGAGCVRHTNLGLTNWLTDLGVGEVGEEGKEGSQGVGEGAGAHSSQHTPTDSPTAQRSAKRSSPSSAWIRSFRLFLVAALFNTALNKGWAGGMSATRLGNLPQGWAVSQLPTP